MRRRLTGTTFFIAAALLAATAAGQSADEARVNGAVSDPNGAYVARASVRIESGATRRELSTNDEGVYDTRLPAGAYRLTVTAPGFCPFRETRLGVEAGRVVTRNVTLRVAAPADVTKVKGGQLRDAANGRPCSLDEGPAEE